jgi:hypothetical protein
MAAIGFSVAQAAVPCSPSNACFGMSFAGSSFSPASGHDQSFNAKDNIVPRQIAINQGESVSYTVNGIHWPAVYQVGMDDEDVNSTSFPAPGCPSGTRVDDPNGRLFEANGCLTDGTQFTVPAGTLTAPGRYLIICQVRPHFLSGMYAFIDVK